MLLWHHTADRREALSLASRHKFVNTSLYRLYKLGTVGYDVVGESGVEIDLDAPDGWEFPGDYLGSAINARLVRGPRVLNAARLRGARIVG